MLKRFDFLTEEQILSLEDMMAALDRVESKNTASFSFDELNRFVMTEIKLLPRIAYQPILSQFIFRARNNIKEHEDLTRPETFSFPPKECTSQGRANIEKHPVFYSSISPHTVLKELKDYEGMKIYLGKWKLRTPINLNAVQFAYDDDVPMHEQWNITNKNVIETLQNLNNPNIRDPLKKKSLLYLHLRIGSWFLSNKYSLSSYVSHSILHDNGLEFPIDAIIYPSVADKIGVNFAIRPNFVNQNLYLDKVMELEVIGKYDTGLKVGADRIGININNKIIWKKITEEDKADFEQNSIMT